MPSPTKTSNPSSQGRPQPGGSSFLSKIFRFIAPCAFPSPVSHPIELPDFQPPPPQEKAPSKTPEQQEPHVAEAQHAETSKPTTALQEHEPQEAISVAPVGDFTEVVVPPTPTIPHLLPPEETEGMTSGAVQPPGSKGDTPVHEKAQHTPISENEDSEYTDEDPDELDDEEDRLIYNGGAGIPIGPVLCSL
jgi:RNA polymerase II subunit A small phosphatase-like protein